MLEETICFLYSSFLFLDRKGFPEAAYCFPEQEESSSWKGKETAILQEYWSGL